MNEKLERLYRFAEEDLVGNLMPWWKKYIDEGENGWFYGRVSPDNVPDGEAERFIVLSARLLWTFSSVYRVTGDKECLELAHKAYRFLRDQFHDKEFGGFYASVTPGGERSDDHKFVYGNAFCIYAMAEYARISGCKEAVELGLDTVRLLDHHVYDPVNLGYYETATRDWIRTPTVRGMNRDAGDEKTMNTHLHLIEAYTNLLRVSDTPSLRSRVRVMLYLFLEKITNPATHHFHYFQARDWTPTTPEMSFGHDIEGSWLLLEAAEVLGEAEAIRDAKRIGANIARAVYDDGVGPEGGLYTEYDPVKKVFSPGYTWWEQSEAVVGFLNAWEVTGEEKFLDASLRTVEFIERCFIDQERGAWYAHVHGDLTPRREVDKATPFICPYHNARMHLEIMERVRRLRETTGS